MMIADMQKAAGCKTMGHAAMRRLAAVAGVIAVAATLAASGTAWALSTAKADPDTGTRTVTIESDENANKWKFDGSKDNVTRLRWVPDKATGNLAYCVNPGCTYGPGEGVQRYPARLLAKSDFKSKALYRACMAALYYAPGGPGYKTEDSTGIGARLFPADDWKGGPFGYKDRFANAHTLLGYYYNDASWEKAFHNDGPHPSAHEPAEEYRKWFMEAMVPGAYGGTGKKSFGQLAIDHYNDADMVSNGGYTVEAWEKSVYLIMTGTHNGLARQDLLTYFDTPQGPLEIRKSAAGAETFAGNRCYSLAGAEYGVFADEAMKNRVGVIITDASGAGEIKSLAAGTYYVKELKAPAGYRLDDAAYTAKVKKGAGATVRSREEPLYAPLELLVRKDGGGAEAGIPQGQASLAGAEFEIRYFDGAYDAGSLPAEATRTWVVRTDEAGEVPAADLEALKVSGDEFYAVGGKAVMPLGTVAVREVKAPEGYQLQGGAAPRIVPVRAGAAPKAEPVYATPTISDEPKTMGLRVKKADSAPEVAGAEGDATLAGATFSVTNISRHPVKVGAAFYAPGEECLVMESEERADGSYTAEAGALPYGAYRIVEKDPPRGYLPNRTWSVEVSPAPDMESGHVFDLAGQACIEEPVRGGIEVRKVDREIPDGKPLGAASLAGAAISVTLASPQPVKVGDTVYETGDVVETIVTDDAGHARTQGTDLPYGTYRLREAKPPAGYEPNDSWEAVAEVREQGAVVEAARVEDQVARGDVRFNKVDGETMERLGAVAFLITSKTTGERHVAVTDENGALDTSSAWTPHTQDTNGNDTLIPGGGAHSGGGSDAAKPEERGPDGEADGALPDPASTAASSSGSADGSSATEEPSPSASSTSPSASQPSSESAASTSGGAADPVAIADVIERALESAFAGREVTLADADALCRGIRGADAHADVPFSAEVANGDGRESLSLIATPQEDGSVAIRDADSDDEVAYIEAAELAVAEAKESSPGSPDAGSGTSSAASLGGTADSGNATAGAGGTADGSASGNGGEDADGTAQGAAEGGAEEAEPEADEADAGRADTGIWFSGRADGECEPDDTLGALPYDTYRFEELRGAANQGKELASFDVTVSRHGVDLDMGTVDDNPSIPDPGEKPEPEEPGSSSSAAGEEPPVLSSSSTGGTGPKKPGGSFPKTGDIVTGAFFAALAAAAGLGGAWYARGRRKPAYASWNRP